MYGMTLATHAHGTSGIKDAIRAGVTSVEHGMLMDEEGIELMKEHGTTLVPTQMCIRDRYWAEQDPSTDDPRLRVSRWEY